MRTNKPSCKYYKGCGSVDNCRKCKGYQKRRQIAMDRMEEIEEAVRRRNIKKR